MQIKAWLNEEGDRLVIEIPTSDNVHKVDFDYDELQDSNQERPLVATVPDITTNTQFGKPIGELPLRDQEQHLERHYQARDEGLLDKPRNDVEDIEDDPDADADLANETGDTETERTAALTANQQSSASQKPAGTTRTAKPSSKK